MYPQNYNKRARLDQVDRMDHSIMASRTHVEVSVLEQTLILQGYCRNRCNWPAVLEHIKQNIDKMPAAVINLYQDGAFTKLRRRMGDQVKKKKDNFIYPSEESKELAAEIKVAEARYSTKETPHKGKKLQKRYEFLIGLLLAIVSHTSRGGSRGVPPF